MSYFNFLNTPQVQPLRAPQVPSYFSFPKPAGPQFAPELGAQASALAKPLDLAQLPGKGGLFSPGGAGTSALSGIGSGLSNFGKDQEAQQQQDIATQQALQQRQAMFNGWRGNLSRLPQQAQQNAQGTFSRYYGG